MVTTTKKKSRKAVPKYTPEQLDRFRSENPQAFAKALESIWAKNPEAATQALSGRGLIPGVSLSGAPASMLVGGGQQQAGQMLEALNLAQQMELGRQGLGQSLLSEMRDMQRDAFSIVPALQTYGAAGGGTMSPAAALAGTGGKGYESPYGAAANRIMDSLVRFATGQGGSVAPDQSAPTTMEGAIRGSPEAMEAIKQHLRGKGKKKPAFSEEQLRNYFTANPGALTSTPERTKMLEAFLAQQKAAGGPMPIPPMNKVNPTTGAVVL